MAEAAHTTDFVPDEEQVRAMEEALKKDRKAFERQQRAEVAKNGFGEVDFKSIEIEYYGKNAVAPADYWERLIHYGTPAFDLKFDDPKHQIYYAVTLLKQKSDGTLMFANEEFFYFDGVMWQKIERRFFGLKLREFAIEIGFSCFVVSNYQGIDNLLKQAEYELFTDAKTPKGLLNFPNGTYDCDRDEFREHRKEDYLLYVLPYSYDPDAKCPLWDSVIMDWVADDVAIVLQELAGYIFMDFRYEKIGMLVGSGRNGKSVFLESISEALGRQNTTNFSLSQVTDETGVFRASMEGKLLNISTDNNQKVGDSGIFKGYVSGEALPMKKLYQQPYTSANYPKTILAMNELPKSDDLSDGFFRRLLIVPFDNQIPTAKLDPELKNKLKNECAGILNWVIAGARRLRTQGRFSDSQTINRMMEEYRRESDTVALFVDENRYAQSKESNMLLSASYGLFIEWCRCNGYASMGIRTYAKRLRGLKFRVEKNVSNMYVWMEVEYRTEEEKQQAAKEAEAF